MGCEVIINGKRIPKDQFVRRLIDSLSLSEKQINNSSDYLKSINYAIYQSSSTENVLRNEGVQREGELPGVGQQDTQEGATQQSQNQKVNEKQTGEVSVGTEAVSPATQAANENKSGSGQEPPSNTNTTTEEGDEEAPVGITHTAVAEMRKKLGLPAYDRTRVTDASLEALADQIIAGGYDITKLIRKIEGGDQPNPLETVILGKYKPILDAEVSANPIDENLKLAKRFADAVDKSGTEEGRMFRLRRFIPAGENSLSDFFVREMETDHVESLTDAQKETVTEEFNEIQDAEKDAQAAALNIQDVAAEEKAKLALSKEKTKTPRQKKTKEDFAKERENITNKIRDKLKRFRTGEEGLSAVPVPYARELFAIAPDVAQLVRSYVAEGVDNLATLTTNVYDAVKEIIPEVTRKDVHDLIAGEYNVNARTKSEISEKIRDIRDEAKLLNKLDKIISGEQPASDVKKRERNREITALRNQINDIQKRNRLDEREANQYYGEDFLSDSDKLRQAVDQYTKRAEKMEEDIRNGIYAPDVKPVPVTQNAELKRQYPELFKKAVAAQDRVIKARKDREIRIAQEQYKREFAGKKWYNKIIHIVGIPLREARTLKASFDYSAPLRQGIIPTTAEMVTNPKRAAERFRDMFKSSGSSVFFDRWMDDLRNTELYDVMQNSGLALTDPNNITHKEEVFQSKFAEKIPVLGKGIKGSERAYSYFLNSTRVDMFTRGVNLLSDKGFTYNNAPEMYKSWAKTVNALTGRGSMPKALEDAKDLLGMGFFSPRLIAARLALFNPAFYAKIPAPLRRMVAWDMIKFVGVMSSILGSVALWADCDSKSQDAWCVELNPSSPDFLKLKVGNLRYDLSGGIVTYMRVIARLVGALFGAKTIKKGGVPGTIGNSIRSKLEPVPAGALDLMYGKDMIGNKVTLKGEALELVTPIIWQDTYEALQTEGASGLWKVTLPGIFGVGVQNYDKNKKK